MLPEIATDRLVPLMLLTHNPLGPRTATETQLQLLVPRNREIHLKSESASGAESSMCEDQDNAGSATENQNFCHSVTDHNGRVFSFYALNLEVRANL
ncbi:hypothetical protein UY3_12244 [Chelonia mydas]|uniref:Uncharacterized protein n=1 Tax=Chelonia mydas TaxID=8469 RepID=M7B0P5_CHEMY|nr:hypothetical protein UY3_12244 [Chelonia mydas]